MTPAVTVFLGPTLPLVEAKAILPDAEYLPPVSQGDVYRVAQRRPWAILVIDGYFARVPSVWHKEILWAMRQGTHVFGASSMGALRAAELAAFGMEGVGAVFKALQAGQLTDDDEVAVLHGPAEAGYLALSEAMVNVRATLTAAARAEVLSAPTAGALMALGKGLFYEDRSYPAILAAARAAGLPEPQLAAFEAWLPTGRVDQKAADARAALALVAERRADPSPKRVRYHFAYTDTWAQIGRRAGREQVTGGDAVPLAALLDEVRLQGPAAFAEVMAAALLRTLSLDEAARQGVEVDGAQAVADLARRLALPDPEARAAWQAANHLDDAGAARLAVQEARADWVRRVARADAEPHVRAVLQLRGDYATLADRAQRKAAALSGQGRALEELGGDEASVLAWYVDAHLGGAPPAEWPAHAEALGLDSVDALLRVVRRAWVVAHSGA